MLPQMGPPEIQTWEFPEPDSSWSLEIAASLADIREGREPDPGINQGIRILEIVEELYRRSGYRVNEAGLS
jgi:hypothetical protein